MLNFLDKAPALPALEAVFPKLPAKDQSFAASLMAQATTKMLSAKQLWWVEELAKRASAPAVEAVKVGATFAGVIALFLTAKQHLKFPAIRLALPGGEEVKLKLAGPNSAHAGSVFVTVDEAYCGRISGDGAFTPTKAAEPFKAVLIALLSGLAADPAGVAAAYGKLTGNCCFCKRGLTDERSTAVGYGPVCADHYNLPWGE